MDPFEISILLIGTTVSLAWAFALGRGAGGEGYWSWGLAVLTAGAACQLAARTRPGFGLTGALLTSAFPYFMLAGAFVHAGRRTPPWLPGVGLAYAILQASVREFGLLREAQSIGLVAEPAVLVAAAFVMRGSFQSAPTFPQRLAPLAMVALALAIGAQRLDGLAGSTDVRWTLWLVFGVPALGVLIMDAFARRMHAESEARDVLADSLGRLGVIAENAYDLMVELDDAFRVRWVSPSVTATLGYEAEEMFDRAAIAFVHPEDREPLTRGFEALAVGQATAPSPVRILRADGSWRWVEGTARRYQPNGKGTRIAVTGRDVTERFAARAALRESQRRLKALEAHSRDMFGELDANGRLVYVSPNVERMLGFTPEEFLGRSLREVAELVRVDDLSEFSGVMLRMEAEGRFERINRIRRKDGTPRWIETDVNTYQTEDGERRAVAVTRDVTERILMEDNLHTSQKLESLALLAGGIAHDFNNALMGIVGNVAVLQERIEPEDDEEAGLRSVVAEIEAAAYRATALTRQLLAYAGRSEPTRRPLDVSAIAAEITRLVERTLPADVSLDVKLADPIPVMGDDTRLRQALLILIANAREAVAEGGSRITVSTGIAQLDRDALLTMELGHLLDEGEYAYLEVADDGHGMDAATRARIFDPFFTTRGHGRGLGLANLVGIARAHGGAIDVSTAPGRGTRCRLHLPLTDGETSALETPAVPSLDPDWRGSGTILVVDDEESIRRLAVRALESRGFTVLVARDGREAVETFRRHAAEIRAVVMDVMMPEMRGDEAFLAMRDYDPDVRVILSSGYGVDEFLDRVPADGLAGFLHKPYRHETLLQRIREILDPE
ncbi:MAG: PAS domain S-box protein [Myxococcales bacterium]|nr:PAS domain S-box protein [Myxococcales bacterium]